MSRQDIMRKMRFVDGKTLQEIGDYFEISRERVRQCIGNTGRDVRIKWTEDFKFQTNIIPKNKLELETLPGVKKVWKRDWGKFRHDALSGDAKLGQEFESKAGQILSDSGIENLLMPNGHPFDILVNGKIRIDVKHSSMNVQKFKSQINIVSPTYSIGHLKCGIDCDFFFVFVPECVNSKEYTYFVIPSSKCRFERQDAIIRIPWPQMGQRPSKWHKYHKNLDILRMNY